MSDKFSNQVLNLFLFQASEEEEKYSFVVEWYDPLATLVRQYFLYYFNQDGTVEMVCILYSS